MPRRAAAPAADPRRSRRVGTRSARDPLPSPCPARAARPPARAPGLAPSVSCPGKALAADLAARGVTFRRGVGFEINGQRSDSMSVALLVAEILEDAANVLPDAMLADARASLAALREQEIEFRAWLETQRPRRIISARSIRWLRSHAISDYIASPRLAPQRAPKDWHRAIDPIAPMLTLDLAILTHPGPAQIAEDTPEGLTSEAPAPQGAAFHRSGPPHLPGRSPRRRPPRAPIPPGRPPRSGEPPGRRRVPRTL